MINQRKMLDQRKTIIKIIEMITDKEKYAQFINETVQLGSVNEEATKRRVVFISGLYKGKTLRFQEKAANLDKMSVEEVKQLFDEIEGDDYEHMDILEAALMKMYYPELYAVRKDLIDRVLIKLIELKKLKTN